MDMDKIDVLIIATAAYIAVTSLVRLMAVRRDQVIRHLRAEIQRQRKAREEAEQEEELDAA
jgi:hypothetical protein